MILITSEKTARLLQQLASLFRGKITVLSSIILFAAIQPLCAVESFITVDQETGHIFASRNRDQRRAIASLTKIATGVVTLDAAQHKGLSLAERVTISPEMLNAGGVNPAGLQAGDTLTVRDLLYCALMSSDNIAALAIAHHVGRRLPNPTRSSPAGNFVAHMNALARTLQMKRTVFLNPHGIDPGEGTVPMSTAADMARITRYAYSEGDFRFFVSQATRNIEVQRLGETVTVTLRNTNRLLGAEGIDGVKTGFTSRAGYCLVLSSFRKPEVIRQGTSVINHPRRLIVVILGARTDDGRFSEGLRMIRQGWSLHEQWAQGGRMINPRQTL